MTFIDANSQTIYQCGALQRAGLELSVTTVGDNSPGIATLLAVKVDRSLHLAIFHGGGIHFFITRSSFLSVN